MQSRVHHEPHQRRLTAAHILGTEQARTDFLSGLLEDHLLVQEARASFLAHLRRDGTETASPLFALAVEDAMSVVLRAAFRRMDSLLLWEERRGPLAGWWGLQALYEYNNDGRRLAERRCGYSRGTGRTVQVVSDHQPDEAGATQPLPLPDETADPADRFERHQAASDLERLLERASGHPALGWLREWLAADALHAQTPLSWTEGRARLSWRYGAQQVLAQHLGVTARTLRNRTREVEALLEDLAGLVWAA